MTSNKLEMDKRYRETHREKLRVDARLYHQLHKTNPEYIRKRREYQLKLLHPRKLLTFKQRQENLRKSRHEWKEKNPDKVLEYYKKYRKLHDFYERWALLFWSKSIRKRDNKICQVCGNLGEASHHLFPKSKHPELMFNLNNGITLCQKHHAEIHWGVI